MTAAVERLRVPPHSIEAERSLLGALLLEPAAWARIANRVRSEDFYRAVHRSLYAAISQLAERGEAVDARAVADALEQSGRLEACGGREYLGDLAGEIASARNVETYANRVREYAIRRGLVAAGDKVAHLGMEPSERSAPELVGDALTLLQGLNAEGRVGRGLLGAQELAMTLLDDLERRREGERGLALGLPDFDRLTYGLEPGDLVVIAGRPGMGKTALLVSIAAHVSRSAGVAIFSAEMPASQLMRRCVALVGNVSQSTLRRPHELTEDDWGRVTDAACTIGARRLWIDDSAAPALAHIRAESMALAARSGLGLVMIDYAQLVRGEGANRYEQLRDVAYGLKGLAKELGIPVIALAQLNRSVEHRNGGNGKRAALSDLRDSGAIEEAADIIGLLYSEGYYDPEFSMPYVLECAVEKNRNGERGECLWHFSGQHSRIGTLEEAARHQYRRMRAMQRQRRHQQDDDL